MSERASTINVTELIDLRPLTELQIRVTLLCALTIFLDGIDVIVIGLGVAVYFAGQWIMTWGGTFGWVAYAPLSKAVSGPFLIRNPWAQFLIWLGLVLVWIVCSLVIYGSSGKSGMDRPNDS